MQSRASFIFRATMLATFALATALPAAAQRVSVGGSAVGVVTHAAPALAGRSLTEAYVTQPILAAHATAAGGALAMHGALNFERWTLRRGELNAGIWGEGYVDRRHPHTLLHEAVLVLATSSHVLPLSLAAGRGFVPFGTDDPMVRPFVKYPANHHHAQILERWIVVGAGRRGPVSVEFALLNGDEPAGPTDIGQPRRIGDSWSARLSWQPLAGWEAQASTAMLRSPEIPGGGGLDQRKFSASLRWEGRLHNALAGYALAEWARSRDLRDGVAGYAFGTALAEAAVLAGGWHAALRLERTQRPEEERAFDAFRTPRPHAGPRLGVTEWSIASAQLRRRSNAFAGAEPFFEASWHHVREIGNGIFEPAAHYGSTTGWNLSAGVRLHAGARHTRMGRYGAAVFVDETHGHDHR